MIQIHQYIYYIELNIANFLKIDHSYAFFGLILIVIDRRYLEDNPPGGERRKGIDTTKEAEE